MKCDELKAEQWLDYGGEPRACYPKAEADKAIAELKQKLEDVQASAYADSVDAGMHERRLRRALCKTCANWAHFAVAFFSSYTTKEKWYRMELKCLKKMEEYDGLVKW